MLKRRHILGAPNMSWNTFPLILEWAKDITPGVRHFAFRRADKEKLEFKAGQFINIHFDRDGKKTHRSYSIANTPGESELIEIAIAPIEGGLATVRLFGMQPGDMLEASGPYGRFVLRDDPACRYVLIATGTGVTPYRSMLPEIRERLQSGEYGVELFLGVRDQSELLFGEDFVQMAANHESFQFTACYSRGMPTEPGAWEREGYVQKNLDGLGLNAETDIIYLCGNPDMVDDATELLKEAGFGIRQIRREKYLPARN